MARDCFEHKMWYYCIKMEFSKIVNFLDTTSDDKDLTRFDTKKWIEVYDQPGGNYNVNKEIIIKTSMLRSDLCDFNYAYIVVKGDITLKGDNDVNKRNKNRAFKNNVLFIDCISKINGVKIDNTEDVVMPIYNSPVYSKNYRKATRSLWNYYRDEPSNPLSSDSESFKYKTSIVGKTPEDNDLLTNSKLVVPLKHLSNFWRSLDIPLSNCEVELILTYIPLSNCEVELILTWSKNCALADMTVDEVAHTAIVAPSGATFKITDTKLYVPVNS